MRTDVKIGIAVGVLVLLVAVIYVAATNDKKSDGKGGDAKIAKVDGGGSSAPEIKVVPVPTNSDPVPKGDTTVPPSHDTSPVPTNDVVIKPLPDSGVAPSGTTAAGGETATGGTAVGGATSATKYTVARGDTFASIAQNRYGDASKGVEIAKANPGITAATLREGVILTLPEIKKETTPVGGAGTAGRTTTGTYTVVAGDNFWKISEKQYGNSKYASLIASANPTVRSDSLKIGQTLTLPPKPAESEVARPAVVLPAGAKEHTVAGGDTLTSISERYYGSAAQWKLIASANPETKDGTAALKLGQKLVIPAAGTPTTGPSRLVRTTPTTHPVDRTARIVPTISGASTASAAPVRPDFSSRVR